MLDFIRRQPLRTIAAAVLVIVLGCLVAGCGASGSDSAETIQVILPVDTSNGSTVIAIVDDAVVSPGTVDVAPVGGPGQESELSPMMTWQWQLQGELNTTYEADVYDIDLFDMTSAQIAELRASGRYVVCYFSAGSFEEWRDDAGAFPVDALGKPLDGWEGERWLDVRSGQVRAILEARLDVAVDKGCDGVEPDNVTAADNDTGFDITAQDQLDFNRFLADAAHDRDLTIGLKNDLDQIPDLVEHFDFAVNEECFEFDECEVYAAFIDAGKPVFNAEYAAEFVDNPGQVCERAAALGLSTLILDLELDDTLRIACR